MEKSTHLNSFLTLIFSLFFGTLLAQNTEIFNVNKVDRLILPEDFQPKFQSIHPIAQKAMQEGIQPGSFKNVTYEFQKNVAVKKMQDFQAIQSKIVKNGILKNSDEQSLKINSDSIYVSEDSDLVFQSGRIDDEDLVIYKPQFEDVFKDFNLPQQMVPVTLANTSYALEGTEVTDNADETNYSMKMEFKDKEYEFEKEFEQDNKKEIIKFKLKINGDIVYNKPSVDAQYTKNSGYRLIFNADEKADLNIVSDISLDFEVAIPVWEFKIPAGSIGEAKVGVYIVVGVGGTVQILVDIDQDLSIHSGVYGGTKYYFPTSVHTVNEFDSHCDMDYTIELTELKAYGGVDCVANIKVKGYDILKIRARGALEVKFELEDNDKIYGIELGLRVLIDGKVKKIDQKFTILDKYFQIWRKEEKNFGGYTLQVYEADAYRDRVHGMIYQTKDSLPYEGDLTLFVTHKNGGETTYTGKTNTNGIFAMTDISLIYGDKVSVIIPDSQNRSETVDAQIPFTEINLNYADYFTNTVQGVISEKVNTFPETPAATQNNVANPAVSTLKNKIQNKNIQQLKPNINPVLEKLNFKNLIVYNGDIEVFIRKSDFGKGVKNPLLNKEGEKKNNGTKPLIQNKIKTNVPDAISKAEPKNIDKIDFNMVKKITMKPFGGFEIENVDIKPDDMVKVRINIDGFILDSGYILADGLLFSPIVDENLQGNASTTTIKADNSFVSVSARRSDAVPQGSVRFLKGVDYKHAGSGGLITIPTTQKVEFFPEAKKPLVFFDKTMNLNTSSKVAQNMLNTGAWEVSNPYYSLSNLSPEKRGGHLFEYVGMDFEGRWTGYKLYQETCTSCDSSLDKIMNLPQNGIKNSELNSEKIDVPIPEMNDIKVLNTKLIQPKLQQKAQVKGL